MEKRRCMIYGYAVLSAAVLLFTACAAYPQTEESPQQPEEIAKSPEEEIAALKMQIVNSKRLLANENRELQNKIDLLQKAVDDLKKENTGLKEANKKLMDNPGELSLKLAKAGMDLDARNLEVTRLKTDASKADAERKDMLRQKGFAAKEIEDLTARNKDLETKLLSVNKRFAVAKNENARMKRELVPVKKLKAKLAISYQQLGTAYAQLKRYDLAIDAYNKSLKYNFNNPVVHCNVGLLYEHSHTRAQRAIYHLNKYLEMDPDASDKNEITFIIKRLSEVEDGDIVFYN